MDIGFTPDQVKLLKQETGWKQLEPQPSLENREAVAMGRVECPVCLGHGMVSTLHEGVVTKMKVLWPVRCWCHYYRLFYQRWNDPKLVPERYRWVDLRKLAPSKGVKMPIEVQQKYIDLLRKRPHFSYLLVGDGGTGKTTFSTALYRLALREWAWRAFETNNPTPAV
jgi:hypothetical protein